MKKHIIQYLKTREVYAGYRASGYSKIYLAAHEEAIQQHKEAKAERRELLTVKANVERMLAMEQPSKPQERKKEIKKLAEWAR